MLKFSWRLSDRIIWVLMVFLFACFLIFETYSWGKYAFFLASALIPLIYMIANGGKLFLSFGAYHVFFLVFVVYVLLSSTWAINASDSITMSRTLFRILICTALVYLYFIKQDNIDALLSAVMWAGYLVAIYSIIFYGLDTVISATTGANTRLNNEYTNVNSIGMACALSCVIQVYNFLYKKFRIWGLIFMVPAVLMMAATQSRKAILFAVIGILGLVVLKNMDNRNWIKGFFKVICAVAGVIVIFFFLSKLEIFSGITERLISLFNTMTDDGVTDSSTKTRVRMIALGVEWWKKNPIGGVGIANPHILAADYLGMDAYLHNNYVELLCGGGIAALVLYYSMYVYLFINLWKYRRADKKYFAIGLVWLILMLAMDYGMVSYYSKSQWFYLMAQFINVKCLKRKHREQWDEIQTAC